METKKEERFYEYSCSSLYNNGKQNLACSILCHLRGTCLVCELGVVDGWDG